MNDHMYPVHARRQQGAALVTALVILLILTILGITALSTTSLEQQMATSVQESQRAFEAGESGLNKVINDPRGFDLHQPYTEEYDFGTYAEAEVTTTFNGWSQPRRNSGYSAISFSSAHFKANSIGKARSGARADLDQGVYQITPKLN